MKKLINIPVLVMFCFVVFSNVSLSQFRHVSNGLPSPTYPVLLLSNDEDSTNIILAALGPYLYYSKDYGESWNFSKEFPLSITVLKKFKNNIFAGTLGGLYLSKTGFDWSSDSIILKNRINCLISINNTLYSGTNWGLYSSTDNGDSWKLYDFDTIDVSIGSYNNILSMLYKDHSIYIGLTTKGLLISNDDGINWFNIRDPKIGSHFYNIININNDIIANSMSQNAWHLIISKDNGKNWEVLYNPINFKYDAYGVANCENNLFIITGDVGLIFSSDYGKNWNSANYNIPIFENIGALIFSGDYIFVGCGSAGNEGGLFKAKLVNCQIDPTSVQEIILPKSDNEATISPNPASDFIEISVGANGRSPLQSDVRIFNIFGQNVMTVGVQNFEPLLIDVSGLVPGMYFVRIGDKVSKFIKI